MSGLSPSFHNSLAPPSDLGMPRNMGGMNMMQMNNMNGMNGMNQMGQMGQMPQMGMQMMPGQPQPQVMTVASMNQGAPAPKAFHRMVNDYNTLKTGYYIANIRKSHLQAEKRTY
jgi:hypothetical protein